MKKILVLAVWTLFLANALEGQQQSIKEYLDAYIGENAKPYIQPLADMLTSNIHTHVWEWSGVDQKFYARLKVQAMVSYPTESMRTFLGKTTGDFQPEQTQDAPTIIGDRDAIIVFGNDQDIFIFPGGYDLKKLTLGTPQLTLGGFLHSEVSGRFLSFPLGQDLGRVRFIGIGGRHSFSSYFQNSPVDFSIGYFYHHIEAGIYLNCNQHLVSVQLGKSGKILSGHIMAGYQHADSDVHYQYMDGEESYNVDLFFDNTNSWIFEASGGIRLGPVFASAGVSYARHVSVAGGVGLFF